MDGFVTFGINLTFCADPLIPTFSKNDLKELERCSVILSGGLTRVSDSKEYHPRIHWTIVRAGTLNLRCGGCVVVHKSVSGR